MSTWPPDFGLAEDYCADVLAGCYDLPVEPKRILDIGANVGAFARWAATRWPGAAVYSYEPHPDNYTLLLRTRLHYDLSNMLTYNLAVANRATKAVLHENGNRGEWSLVKFGTGDGQIEVEVIDAAELQDADFLKIDTEGAEPAIIKRLGESGKLAQFIGIVLEYHSATSVAPLIFMCQQAGLRLHEALPYSDHRGVLKFIRP